MTLLATNYDGLSEGLLFIALAGFSYIAALVLFFFARSDDRHEDAQRTKRISIAVLLVILGCGVALSISVNGPSAEGFLVAVALISPAVLTLACIAKGIVGPRQR